MKKCLVTFLCLALAAALTLSCFASIDVGSYKTKDGDTVYYNEDEFSIESPSETLHPGADYFLKTEWGRGEITDDFFEYYNLSTSYVSDTEGLSNAGFGHYISAAEFVKGADGKYYYRIRVTSSRSLNEDIDGGIIVYAKDKADSDKRYAAYVEFTIGYESMEFTVDDDEYSLPDGGAIVEFEKGIKKCLITFDNDSTLDLVVGSKKKYNLCYAEDVNTSIASANPGAVLKQMTFYGHPVFAESSRFKFYAGKEARYFYELNDNNTLTQVGTKNVNADGFFSLTTDRLGTYISSNVPLKNAVVGSGSSAASTAAATSVTEGWVKQADGTMKYRLSNGSYVQNGWISVGSNWYCFDANGVLRTNQWVRNTNDPKVWYYVGADGAMVRNQYVGQFYVNANGVYYGP